MTRWADRLRPALRRHWIALALLPVLWHAFVLSRTIATRVRYPMALEWMEGGVLLMAARIGAGLEVYPPPHEGYMPLPYPVGYPAMVALLGKLSSVDYVTGRTISVVALIVTAACLAREVFLANHGPRIERATLAGICVGAIAASYPVVDGWYDLARVDMAAVALVVLAAALVAGTLDAKRSAIAGLLLAMAFFTKQSSAPFIAWILIYAAWRHRGRALPGLASAAFCFGVGIWLIPYYFGSHYWFYTFTLLSLHEVQTSRMGFSAEILLLSAPYLPLIPALALVLAGRRQLSPRTALWCGMAVVAFAAGVYTYAKDGGYLNNLLAPCVLLPAAALCLVGELSKSKDTVRRIAPSVAVLTAAFLLVYRAPEYDKYIVTSGLWTRAARLNKRVRSINGTLTSPLFPILALRNGKKLEDQLHVVAHNDFGWAKIDFLEGYRLYLQRNPTDYILVTNTENTIGLVREVYEPYQELTPWQYDTVTRIGFPMAPRLIMRRKK